jgi:hypothetical protein
MVLPAGKTGKTFGSDHSFFFLFMRVGVNEEWFVRMGRISILHITKPLMDCIVDLPGYLP